MGICLHKVLAVVALSLAFTTISGFAVQGSSHCAQLTSSRSNISDISYEDICGRPYKVTYDSRAILIDEQRVLLRSGCVHYARSTPMMWPIILSKAKNNGLNTIETYVFWNLHQPDRTPGKYDFTGRRNLRQFLQMCADAGLFVVLRIGPYVCAEWDYGGLPLWLQYVQDMQFRSYNERWMDAVRTWMKDVIDYVRPFYAENGGPIIISQIENEYRLSDDHYVEWCGELTKEFGLSEPWVMCNGKSAKETINTCNSCYCGESYVDSHAELYPDQPLMWTEIWQKHEIWGEAQFQRDARDLSYAVVQWVARGGTHFSYYMWHGGHNYERTAASTITQHYQDNAVLHSDTSLNDPKYHHVGRLHSVLAAYSDVILGKAPTDCRIMDSEVNYETTNASRADNHIMLCDYTLGSKSLFFLFSRYSSADTPVTVDFCKMKLVILPTSAVILNSSCSLLFNTSEILPTDSTAPITMPVADQLEWKYWIEPRGPKGSIHQTDKQLAVSSTPIEQLELTHDKTDFVWYEVKVPSSLFNITPQSDSHTGTNTLTIETTGSNVFVLFVNGEQKGSWLNHNHTGDTKATITFTTSSTTNHQAKNIIQEDIMTLSILSFAMGISTRVEMRTYERKGIVGAVSLNGQDITDGSWLQRAYLQGEIDEVFTTEGSARVDWKANVKSAEEQSVVWLQTTFDVDPSNGPVLLNATGLNLGHAYVNGQDIGRYWLVTGECTTPTSCGVHYEDGKCGEPTQTFYHIPPDWLHPEDNLLTLIEVVGASDLTQPGIFQKHVPAMYNTRVTS